MKEKRSRLVLGTAQLGLSYGLNNMTGQPSEDESYSILDRAAEAGIRTIDTAFAYGNAEEVVGAWLRKKGMPDISLITKFKPNVLDDHPDVTPQKVIKEQLRESLMRLGVERIDGYLLHTPAYLYTDGAVDGLREVKAEGLALHIGVSTYDEEDALRAIDLGLDYIQVPYNAFDQRLERTNFFEKAIERGVTIFARSPFLQGLLLIEPDHIPFHLQYAKEHIVRFRSIAERYDLSPLEASLTFVLGVSHITRIVFGVETFAQLEEGLHAVASAEKEPDLEFVLEIQDAFENMDPAVVNPSLWSKKTN